jgi:hypothetical protein
MAQELNQTDRVLSPVMARCVTALRKIVGPEGSPLLNEEQVYAAARVAADYYSLYDGGTKYPGTESGPPDFNAHFGRFIELLGKKEIKLNHEEQASLVMRAPLVVVLHPDELTSRLFGKNGIFSKLKAHGVRLRSSEQRAVLLTEPRVAYQNPGEIVALLTTEQMPDEMPGAHFYFMQAVKEVIAARNAKPVRVPKQRTTRRRGELHDDAGVGYNELVL